MKFEDFLKETDEFTAAQAREISQEKAEQQKIDEFKQNVTLPEFISTVEKIKAAAQSGSTKIEIYPVERESIEERTKNHKPVPEEMLKFNENQKLAFQTLVALGYVVTTRYCVFYAEGMNEVCDMPLKSHYATIYWGID